jgi:uncharacterized protein YdeI (YjbR/CyaY-like superfamily)
MKAIYFESPAAFRKWLEKNHDKADELLVGFHKRDSGKPSMTWPESVDEALCFGWIDGVRKSVDDERYTIRFTPRKQKSIWSAVNLRKMEALLKAGRVAPAGMAAYERRPKDKAPYSFEQRPESFGPEYEKQFRANRKAWAFFESQPPGYRRIAMWFVLSAKKDETRQRRLQHVIEISAKGERLEPMTPAKKT